MWTDGDPPSDAENLSTRWTRIDALHGRDADQAWRWFVERYKPFVRGLLASMLGAGARTAHAEAEFWGYVWLSGALARADRNRRFRAFLSGIVRNFARSFARNRGLPLAEGAALDGAAARDGSRTELMLWVDNVIANAMQELRTESQATATAIASFYGLPHGLRPGAPMAAGDIAAAVGNTTQGVYMLLFRGRKRLRTLIELELRAGCPDEAAVQDELRQLVGLAAGLLGEA